MLSIIVSYYNQPFINLWFESLLNNTCQDYEVCVVNDGGDQYDILGIIRLYEKRIRINYKYLGPRTSLFRIGSAKNLAAQMATGDRMMITDPDCLFHHRTIESHLRAEHMCAGIRSHIPAAYVNSLTKKSLKYLNRICVLDERYNHIHRFVACEKLSWQLLWGSNISIDRRDFELIGGFSEEYLGWGYEDLELISRILENNISTSINYKCLVYHLDHGQNRSHDNRRKFMKSLSNIGVTHII